jgi:hypothetical protein
MSAFRGLAMLTGKRTSVDVLPAMLIGDSRTSSANGVFGRYEPQDSYIETI